MKKNSSKNIAQPLGRILSHAGRNFLSMVNKNLEHLDIKRNFFALLLIEKEEGKMTQQELADLMNSDKVSVVRIINYLSEKGYVKRRINRSDRRKYSILLTEKAKKDLPKIKETLNEVTKIAYHGINSARKSEFLETLNIIRYNLTK